MTTPHTQTGSSTPMASSSLLSAGEARAYSHRLSGLNPDLLSIPNEEDEANLDETATLPPAADVPGPIRPSSGLFAVATSPHKRVSSRQYRFVQLERSLRLADLLNDEQDRLQFDHDYRQSLQDNKLDEFLQKYYRKLHVHKETIRRENAKKTTRTFAFVDLEKNFLASDPTRDIKIVFVDNPTRNFLASNASNNYSPTATQLEDAAVEAFYKSVSRRFLYNPSRAREQIALFVRQAGERLQDSLPCLSHAPYRVKLIDERDKEQLLDERALLQLRHKQNLSVISRRRQLIMNMVIKTRKNQDRMKQLDKSVSLEIDNSTYCQELLARVKDAEQSLKDQPARTNVVSRQTSNVNSSSPPTRAHSVTASSSARSPPFRDAISAHHVRRSAGVHVIQPKQRPLTNAATKSQWKNYC